MSDMTADQALREQVARLLAGLEPGEPWPTNEQLGGSMTGTRDDEYKAGLLEDAELFLPLFAARERAAAEKALRDAADEFEAESYANIEQTIFVDGHFLTTIQWLNTRADTVRAQLEGDGA